MKTKQLIAVVVALASAASFVCASQPASNDELRSIVAMGSSGGGGCGKPNCIEGAHCADIADGSCGTCPGGYIHIFDVHLDHYCDGAEGTGNCRDDFVDDCLKSQEYDCFIEGGLGGPCSSVPAGPPTSHGFYFYCYDCTRR
jgi:hypothetical protein